MAQAELAATLRASLAAREGPQESEAEVRLRAVTSALAEREAELATAAQKRVELESDVAALQTQLREQAAAAKRATAAVEQTSATAMERLQKAVDAATAARDDVATKLAKAEGDAAREATRLKQARATITALEEQLARSRQRERAGANAGGDAAADGSGSDGQAVAGDVRAAMIEIDELHGQLSRQREELSAEIATVSLRG